MGAECEVTAKPWTQEQLARIQLQSLVYVYIYFMGLALVLCAEHSLDYDISVTL